MTEIVSVTLHGIGSCVKSFLYFCIKTAISTCMRMMHSTMHPHGHISILPCIPMGTNCHNMYTVVASAIYIQCAILRCLTRHYFHS